MFLLYDYYVILPYKVKTTRKIWHSIFRVLNRVNRDRTRQNYCPIRLKALDWFPGVYVFTHFCVFFLFFLPVRTLPKGIQYGYQVSKGKVTSVYITAKLFSKYYWSTKSGNQTWAKVVRGERSHQYTTHACHEFNITSKKYMYLFQMSIQWVYYILSFFYR
jgi:hypothetical protein